MEAADLFKKMLMEYDKGSVNNSTFYDHLPYIRDHELAQWKPRNYISGNVYKNYQYKLVSPVIIQNDFNFIPEAVAIGDMTDDTQEMSDEDEFAMGDGMEDEGGFAMEDDIEDDMEDADDYGEDEIVGEEG